MKTKISFSALFTLTLILLLNLSARAGDDDKIVIGDRLKIKSDVLNEERPVLVYRPAGYENSQQQYPVLYLLDGDFHFLHVSGIVQFLSAQGFLPQMIVVGIPNTNRQRDFTPTQTKDNKANGGAENFIKFMETELFPMIEKNYRTVPYRVLMGHSLCGMFSVYTLFNHPDLFNSYLAISPWLLYDDELLIRNAEKMFQKNKDLNKFLYMTVGDEAQLIPVLDRFSVLLKESGPQKLNWKLEKMLNDNHNTVVHNSVYNGLLELYLDWRIPTDLGKDAVVTLRNHFQKLSEKFGYPVFAPENTINQLGYLILNNKMFDQAIGVFKLNVEKYPASANVYDSLGEAYETKGELKAALENYEVAVKTGEKNEDRNLPIFKDHLLRVKQKMGETSQSY